jgi:hypothetical protein
MRKLLLLLFLLSQVLFSCNVPDAEVEIPEVQVLDLSSYKMKILPASPRLTDDVKLIVFEDCGYNKLAGVQKDGFTINIEKQFNSMMMMPCFIRNDTILIGKLPAGTYRVNYKLTDLSTKAGTSTPFSISFKLLVNN